MNRVASFYAVAYVPLSVPNDAGIRRIVKIQVDEAPMTGRLSSKNRLTD